MSQIGVGVVGCGAWGKNLARVFSELGVLVAICEQDARRMKEVSERHRVPKAYLNPSDLFQDPSVTAVAIAAPSEFHHPFGRAALLAGKDVFLEKPMALSYAHGLELTQLAGRRKRILMVGHILEYHPAVLTLESLLQSGELGKLFYVYSSRLNLGTVRQEENILWSFAPHDIAVILRLTKEAPLFVSCMGGNYLQPNVADVTLTSLTFPGGIKGHLFVSWLHPYKEQKLILAGSRKMAILDDVVKEGKLKLLDQHVEWEDGSPKAKRGTEQIVEFGSEEPLKNELQHFLKCLETRSEPITSGRRALAVLKVLEAAQYSLSLGGSPISLNQDDTAVTSGVVSKPYSVHPTAIVDANAVIGKGTKIWHFSHVCGSAEIGENCVLGQNVYVGPDVKIGNNVKIQNNVSVYEGVILEDDVFCGPSCVFTNVMNPRSHVSRKNEFRITHVGCGASIGANATIVCGVTIGEYAFIGAGAVVTRDVPPHALAYGAPARVQGWMCSCGEKLAASKDKGRKTCSRCGNVSIGFIR